MKRDPLARTPFSALNTGAVFHIDRCPGNIYRKVDAYRAEFVQHRLGPDLRGYVVSILGYTATRTEPLSPAELELLGVDPREEPFRAAAVFESPTANLESELL